MPLDRCGRALLLSWPHEQKTTLCRGSASDTSGPAKGASRLARGARGMGGHYSACPQRVDLLGDLRQEARDTQGACRAGTHATDRRHASTLLLARLSASIRPGFGRGFADVLL